MEGEISGSALAIERIATILKSQGLHSAQEIVVFYPVVSQSIPVEATLEISPLGCLGVQRPGLVLT